MTSIDIYNNPDNYSHCSYDKKWASNINNTHHHKQHFYA